MALKRYGVRVPAAPPSISVSHGLITFIDCVLNG